jgi:hypothetical protein
MKELKLKELKLKELKSFICLNRIGNYYRISFTALIPTISNSNILIPLRMVHETEIINVEGKRKLVKERLLRQLAEEINKIILFYNYDTNRHYKDSFGQPIISYIYKDNIPENWKNKELSIELIRKIIYKYLADLGKIE